MAVKIDDLIGNSGLSPEEIPIGDISGLFDKPTQRQSYYEQQEENNSKLVAGIIDPYNEAKPSDYGDGWSEEEIDQIEVSPERAKRTGESIAKVIDTSFNFVASNLIAKDSKKEYKALPKDLEDLAEAWGNIASDKQWEFSPGWQIAILNIIVYGPLVKEAFQDRKFKELQDEQDRQKDEIKRMKDEISRINSESRSNTTADTTTTAGAGNS